MEIESCPIESCHRQLVPLPLGQKKCPFHNIVWNTGESYRSGNLPTAPIEQTVSLAQKRWVDDVASRFASDSEGQRHLAKILYDLFEGKTTLDQAVLKLRVETGAHITKIQEAMRNAMLENPEAMREVQQEGIELPFMSEEKPAKKRIVIR